MLPTARARLIELGFDNHWEAAFARLVQPWDAARVASDRGSFFELLSAIGAHAARLSAELLTGPLRPVVGDWIAERPIGDGAPTVIEAILPRRTTLRRRAPSASGTVEQVLAANVDAVFAVLALDRDFNLRRLERLLALAWSSGAQPAVLLTKADVHAEPSAAVRQVRELAGDVPIVVTSAISGAGLEEIRAILGRGRTGVLLGSSGIGKSSLVNALLHAETLDVGAVRDKDGRGRHTTTARELMEIPETGMIIDTPGLREVQLWLDDASVDLLFADLHELVARCRFSNCGHRAEPGCAVRSAIEAGDLARARWHAFVKLRDELSHTRERVRDRERHQAMLRKRRATAALKDLS